ncbi:unnamed protein product [Urochloa humidicola]
MLHCSCCCWRSSPAAAGPPFAPSNLRVRMRRRPPSAAAADRRAQRGAPSPLSLRWPRARQVDLGVKLLLLCEARRGHRAQRARFGSGFWRELLPARARDPRRRLPAAAAIARVAPSLEPWSTSSTRRRARRRSGLGDARAGGFCKKHLACLRQSTPVVRALSCQRAVTAALLPKLPMA